ncbi:OmpA/MotB family protein [Isachenkonia alkalipeptolytica]|uniref:Flagellar motor protein MotB n=1 Tax=Isachenkonia alkalipeptolytica TaxID=2565777 RepID=A0AA43XJR4_9CLOT|nr:flagellar motor protein MotB [Isachenkonia alkalipeptolytica]NBG87574.1 flagellar motor protein MotB [Isachenkonia alkalipeptolytica]
MARRRQQENEKKGSPAWMTTYADIVTLLLAFFVILFAMSEIDVQKFEAVIRSFQGSLGVLDGGQIVEEGDLNAENMNDYYEEIYQHSISEGDGVDREFGDLQERVQSFIEDEGLDASVLVSMESQGLMLRFQDDVLFDSAEADLKDEAEEVLGFITDILQEQDLEDKFIRVEGHTDNLALLPDSDFETNWELSVARAVTAGRHMIEEENVDPSRLSMAGYGEYHPIADNSTAEGRSQNRRVDIVILRTEIEIE